MALISQALRTLWKEQDLIPDALEIYAKSTIRRTEKPVQTTLPLKKTDSIMIEKVKISSFDQGWQILNDL